MLRGSRDFAALAAAGASRSHPLLVIRFRRTERETSRFGFAIGRRLGSAVRRNRLRRRIRAALRSMASTIGPGFDVLIVARPPILTADHTALVGALRSVLDRAGVTSEAPRS
jgi:ribonuclease P protein component